MSRDDDQATSKGVKNTSSQFKVNIGQRIYIKEVYELDQYLQFHDVILMATERTEAPFCVINYEDITIQSEKGRNILEGSMTAEDRLTKINLKFDGQTNEYLIFAKIQRGSHEGAVRHDLHKLNETFQGQKKKCDIRIKANRINIYKNMVLDYLSVCLQVKHFQN